MVGVVSATSQDQVQLGAEIHWHCNLRIRQAGWRGMSQCARNISEIKMNLMFDP
jgi:hypothetical protein